ncbi:MAG: DUF1800 domain-containing protein [Acidobacteriaceae bacterium]|nr:DUF1800 domain-containing protein [Acidobacteriaceae bacterium]
MAQPGKRGQIVAQVMGLVLLLSPLIAGTPRTKKIKPIKPNANPPEYVAFSKPVRGDDQIRHAIERLTFGARPGDFERVKQMGLDNWLDLQLHPEKVAENPSLGERLAPFDSLRMSMREAYIHYPPPQMIIGVARGTMPAPEDPELRAVVLRLADAYVWRRSALLDGSLNGVVKSTPAADPNDDSDLARKVKVTDILTAEQIDKLKNGKPDEKRAVLESIPADKRFDFIYALNRQQRQQLFAFAPVTLRRDLMLAVSPQNVVASDLTEAKLLRAIYSNHQLYELMADFWYNHFNVFINKGADRYLVPTYEREAIRPHVFGKFYDLLLATAESPAMLLYLDNAESVSSSRQRPNAKYKRGLNENYGRELLELHTLGVDGGYTQKDVIEVARCFTGWTIANPRKGGVFEYNDKVHDKGEKVVLGHVIRAGGGMNDGLQVLEIVAHHPSTAHFISLKLAKRFVADNPPPSLVNRMAQTFLKKDGDIRQVMQTMLYSPEFWSPGAYRAKVKMPLEMVVSSVRATNAQVDSSLVLANEIQKLGEPLYGKIEPTGYSSANAEWVSSAGLLERMNFAIALAHNRIPGVKVNTVAWQNEAGSDPMALARSILEQDPSTATKEAIEKALSNEDLQKQLARNAKAGPPQVPSLIAGLVIGSPEFQRR